MGFLACFSLILLIQIDHVKAKSLQGRGVDDNPRPKPLMPSIWPSANLNQIINGALLQDPLVTNALAIVESTVPPALLQIPPSTYISGSTVNYNGNVAENCYWPANQCLRTAGGSGYDADVYTCKDPSSWGLTYDDGPTQNIVNGVHVADTAAIRNQLALMNLTATFFVTGINSMRYPEELVLHDKAGHQIASHTWSHHPLTSLTNAQIVAELMYTEAIIYQTIGKAVSYLRPPYGDVDDRVRAVANALGYRVAMWDRDSLDAANPNTDQSTVLGTIRSWFKVSTGFVSLQHDVTVATSQTAVDALKEIAAQGSTFMLKIQPMGTCNFHSFYRTSASTTSSTLGETKTEVSSKMDIQTGTAEANVKPVPNSGIVKNRAESKRVVFSNHIMGVLFFLSLLTQF